MFFSLCAFIVLFPLACGDTIDTCSSEDSLSSIASHFRQYPDARKLINHTDSLYCLVYHSVDAAFKQKMPCLCTRVSFVGRPGESFSFLYQYSPNKTQLYTGVTNANTKTTDKAFRLDNEIIINEVAVTNAYAEQCRPMKGEVGSVPVAISRLHLPSITEESAIFVHGDRADDTKLWSQLQRTYFKLYTEAIRVLFADYYSCAVLNSTILGTMLWVKLDHLLKEEQMPYLCTLTYQLAAQDTRYMVYDWKVCPEMRSYKENTKRPNTGQKNKSQ